ncbi:MAG: ATP-binding protein [Patescibacteria group bacterium]|nr:ATP-binding protein [Patescibacteria group bacterium]
MYNRIIQKDVEKWLERNKIIIIYGARQVGKTTLVKQIAEKFEEKAKYYDCDFGLIREKLGKSEKPLIENFLKGYELIIFDEAQRVKNIGLSLKIMRDNFPEKKIIATGSSSFDLANKISEPLTGRTIEFLLFPLSIREILQKQDRFEIEGAIENIIRFGLYPDVYGAGEEAKKDLLFNITNNYLYKDILEFENIKKSDQLFSLLQLLALQIGNEVSFDEIGRQLGMNKLTVQKYVDLLEKSFVIFSLHSFSRNLRKEISKSIKIYFWDLGIRNALVNNFNSLAIRSDAGALWENFCVAERMKFNFNSRKFINSYFWRTYDQQEIDLIEERDGKLFGYEIKWNAKKYKEPKLWREAYKNAKFKIINKENCLEFIAGNYRKEIQGIRNLIEIRN